MRRHFRLGLSVTAMTLIAAFGWSTSAKAATTGSRAPTVKHFSQFGLHLNSFNAFPSNQTTGVRLALGDTDADGQLNVITASGQGASPKVKVFTLDGNLISTFAPYSASFRGGVNVAAFDLDADGTTEIITAPGIGGGPEIRIYKHDGTLIRRFFAFDKKFRGGASVTAGAFGRNGEPLIAVASGHGSGHVRVFNPAGEFTGISFFPFGSATHGLTIATLPIVGQRSQLVVAPQQGATSLVKIFSLNETSTPVRTFTAFPTSFRGGVRLAAADLDSNGTAEVIIAAGGGGGPHVKIFTADGSPVRSFFAYATSFRGGVNLAAAQDLIMTGPSAIGLDGRTDLHKYIEVDLSDQTLKYFQDGRLLGTRRVSTGKWTTPTPIGTHVIKNKIPVAYSKPYDLYMEWWMAFTPDGSYGLHALPYWKTASGSKYYEGASHLGTPVSHGCIRQTLAEAKALFGWADIGTTVIVKR